jgi:hypothetical protein
VAHLFFSHNPCLISKTQLLLKRDRINWDGPGVIHFSGNACLKASIVPMQWRGDVSSSWAALVEFLNGKESKILPRNFFLRGQPNASNIATAPSIHILTNGLHDKAEVDISDDFFSISFYF